MNGLPPPETALQLAHHAILDVQNVTGDCQDVDYIKMVSPDKRQAQKCVVTQRAAAAS